MFMQIIYTILRNIKKKFKPIFLDIVEFQAYSSYKNKKNSIYL